jgi:hypothetical protein
MWSKLVFRLLSAEKKIQVLKSKGIIVGTRLHHDRKVYLFLLNDFFAEVVFEYDDMDLMPEKIETFSSLKNLNSYLENDFGAAF